MPHRAHHPSRPGRVLGAAVVLAVIASLLAVVTAGGASAVTPVRVDFGPDGVAPAPGFVRWDGSGWRASSGMGFVDSATGRSEGRPLGAAAGDRDRDVDGTHVSMDRGPGGYDDPFDPSAFEVALAPGRYRVALTVGDAEPLGHHQNVDVEGVAAVTGWRTSPSQPTLTVRREVSVLDGRLTLSPRGRGDTKLVALEVEPVTVDVPPTASSAGLVSVVFGDASLDGRLAATIVDSGDAFDPRAGHGWVDEVGNPRARPDGSVVDPRGVRMNAGATAASGAPAPGTFELAVANGTYDVAVMAGTRDLTVHDAQNVDVEGDRAIVGFAPTERLPYTQASVRVRVTDGRLTVSSRVQGDTVLLAVRARQVEVDDDGPRPAGVRGDADSRTLPSGILGDAGARPGGVQGDVESGTVPSGVLGDDDTLWVGTYDNAGDWWEHHGITRTFGPQDQDGTLDGRRFRPVPAPGFGRGDALRIDFNPDANPRIRTDDAQFGVRWSTSFESMGLGSEMRDEAYLRYRLFVPEDFPCETTGGKLPGLSGNPRAVAAPESGAGGGTYDGTAWSGRIMWAPDCRMVSYLYVDRIGGTSIEQRRLDNGRYVGFRPPWTDDDGTPVTLDKGEWNTIELHYRMNTLGRANGVHRAWLNGDQVVDLDAVEYRTNAYRDLGVNEIRFDFFYGGTEGAPQPSRLFIDDVVLADDYIG